MEIRQMSKEDFIKKYGKDSIFIYEAVKKSKMGDIEIEKISNDPLDTVKVIKMKGVTPGFGEGISCCMEDKDMYYYTSTIQSIDWENNIFHTLNSEYKFKFNERDITSEIQETA
jgi:hypothetical protein